MQLSKKDYYFLSSCQVFGFLGLIIMFCYNLLARLRQDLLIVSGQKKENKKPTTDAPKLKTFYYLCILLFVNGSYGSLLHDPEC